MKKISTTLLFFTILFATAAQGQFSSRQVGVRTGYRSGIFCQVTGESGNAETGYNVLLSFNRGIQLTGLRVIYEQSLAGISPDLFLAYGYGGHAGFVYTDHFGFMGDNYYFDRSRGCLAIGADGWLAAEYRFPSVPLNISLNLKPFVELNIPSFVKIIPWDMGISVSYVF